MHGYGVEGEHNCADLDPFVAPMHPSPNLHYMDCKYVSAWELQMGPSLHSYHLKLVCLVILYVHVCVVS